MAQHRLAEGLVEAVLVALQADLDEGLDAETELLAVEPGDIAADGAAGLELLGAAQAGRGGEADPLGEIDIGDPAFFLEYAEDPEIGGIEGSLGHVMPQFGRYTAENADISTTQGHRSQGNAERSSISLFQTAISGELAMAASPAAPKEWPNPMGTDGFEFVEYTAPDTAALRPLFETHGLSRRRPATAPSR